MKESKTMSVLQQVISKFSVTAFLTEKLIRCRDVILSGLRQLIRLIKSAKTRFLPGDVSKLQESILAIAIEEYRMREVFTNILFKLNPADAPRFENRYRYFSKEVEKALTGSGFRVVGADCFVGKTFDTGMAVKPLNIKSFNKHDELIIDQMIEPVIMNGDKVVNIGVVKLRRT
jgi:hypothetical protein